MHFHRLILSIYLIMVNYILKFNCLFPRETLTREIKNLDGIWKFRICSQDNQDIGFTNKWFKIGLEETGEVLPMPVPSSFNDITQNKTIRDYLGWSWYQKEFYVPKRWKKNFKIILRFGSAHYIAYVYLNGEFVMNHTGGHLPFEKEITRYLNYYGLNKITVALNNTLSPTTIPQGNKLFKSKKDGPYPSGFYVQETNFDFFNYAGIHRSVILYAIPRIYIKDISIKTDIKNRDGYIDYSISISSTLNLKPLNVICLIEIIDKNNKQVAQNQICSGIIVIKNATFWWPYSMHDNPGYLYHLCVKIFANNLTDIYCEPFGIRTIKIIQNNFLINGKPFYFMGFGKHEDSNIRGKGLDLPLVIKDFNLIKWIGANSFRTSHYPYAEEIMDQADAQGIVVIDECPAVGLDNFKDNMLQQHKIVLKELVSRDKNRPSVIAWSVANEPSSSQESADKYFSKIVAHVKELDNTRPVTAALNVNPQKDKAGKHMDFIMMNHYFSWYSDTGSTEVIFPLLINYISEAYVIYKKPIMMSEYGADTVAGLHMDPPFIFTEDYQTEMMIQHHLAFDILRTKAFFIGEHIWNFADFLTLQQINRVVGNKKGIFTRERQPKASAKLLRCRYHHLMNRTIEGSAAYCPSISNNNVLCK